MGLEAAHAPTQEVVQGPSLESLPTTEEKIAEIPREQALVPYTLSDQEVVQLQAVRERLGLSTSTPLLEHQKRLEYKASEEGEIPLVEGVLLEGISFTPEEIAAARQEAIIDGEFTEVDVIERAAKNASNERIATIQDSLIQQYGGPAHMGSVHMWENVRTSYSASMRIELIRTMSTIQTEVVPGSLLDKILKYFEATLFPQSVNTTEAANNNPHILIAEYIEENGAELTGDKLGEVEDALQLVSLNDQYLFFEGKDSGQLETTVELQQKLLTVNDEFDPARSGLLEVRKSLEHADAALQLDFVTKPEMEPVYAGRMSQVDEMRDSLRHIESAHYLQHHEVEE